MKKILGILVLGLLLITPSWADDIRDFQIEGISLGDSALDYISKEEIKKYKSRYYKDDTYTSVTIFPDTTSTNIKFYDSIVLSYKTNDDKFLLRGLSGIIKYQNNIDECFVNMHEVINDLSEVFSNANPTKIKTINTTHGKNTFSIFNLDFGDKASVQCTDYDAKYEFIDHLRIVIDKKDFSDWIDEKAYK